MTHSLRDPLKIASTVMALCLAAWSHPPAAGAQSDPPRAQEVKIQRTGAFPDHGNALITAVLSPAEVAKLDNPAFFSLGDDESAILFRDDAGGGDAKGGDGTFTAVAFVRDEDLIEKSNDEAPLQGTSEPVFDGRALVGSAPAEPFDVEAFNAGQEVTLAASDEVALSRTGAEPTSTTPALISSGGELVATAAAAIVPGTNAFQEKVLMIRDPSVVTDPARTYDPCTDTGTRMGVWTFGHVMTEMANQAASGIHPSDFVEQWLLRWTTNQTINSFNVPARPIIQQLIDDWRTASGGGPLDLGIAPFRLLAIVSRLDLRRTVGTRPGYGRPAGGNQFLDAGEARFVFGIVLPAGYTDAFIASVPLGNGCRALRYSVIVEYGIPKCDCKEVRQWARDWVKLDSFTLGSPAYLAHLQRLTESFVRANANPLKPNGSALNQLRSNEIALAFPWELRENQLTQFPFSLLQPTTTNDTPHDSFNNTPTFSDFVLNGPRPVPLLYPPGSGQSFLGGNPQTPGVPGSVTFHWNGPLPLDAAGNPLHNNLRHLASLGTCNGCHGGETLTEFVHVSPMTPGLPATLSGFLTGIQVPDAAVGSPVREFDDLARREQDIKRLARILCFRFRPIPRRLLLSLAESNGGLLPPDPFEGLTVPPVEKRPPFSLDELVRDPLAEVH